MPEVFRGWDRVRNCEVGESEASDSDPKGNWPCIVTGGDVSSVLGLDGNDFT